MADAVQLQSLALLGHQLRLPMGLVIDEVEVHADGLTLEGMRPAVAHPAKATVRLSAASLQEFIAPQLPAMVQGLQVRLERGLILATTTVKLLVEVRSTAELRPRLVEGKELHLEVVGYDGPGVARVVLDKQIEAQNPVFRVSDLPFPAELLAVRIESMLEMDLTLSLPE